MSKQKFYVVWKGNNPGVYQSWEKCQDEIKNVNGALFKSFVSLEEAKKAYDQGYEKYKQSLDYINISDKTGGGILAPPVAIPKYNLCIAWDSLNGGLYAVDQNTLQIKWSIDIRPTMQPIVFLSLIHI